jgi:hypothetical protein
VGSSGSKRLKHIWRRQHRFVPSRNSAFVPADGDDVSSPLDRAALFAPIRVG